MSKKKQAHTKHNTSVIDSVIISGDIVSITKLKKELSNALYMLWTIILVSILTISTIIPPISMAGMAPVSSSAFSGLYLPGYSLGGIQISSYGVDLNEWATGEGRGTITSPTIAKSNYGVWSGSRAAQLEKAIPIRQEYAAKLEADKPNMAGSATKKADNNKGTNKSTIGVQAEEWKAVTTRWGYNEANPNGQDKKSNSTGDTIPAVRTPADIAYWAERLPSTKDGASITANIYPDFVIVAQDSKNPGQYSLPVSPASVYNSNKNGSSSLVNTSANPIYVPLKALFDAFNLTDGKDANMDALLEKLKTDEGKQTFNSVCSQANNNLLLGTQYKVPTPVASVKRDNVSTWNPYPYTVILEQTDEGGNRITSPMFDVSELYMFLSPESAFKAYMNLRAEYDILLNGEQDNITKGKADTIFKLGYYLAGMAICEAYLTEALPQDMTRGYLGASEPTSWNAQSSNGAGSYTPDGSILQDWKKLDGSPFMYDVAKNSAESGNSEDGTTVGKIISMMNTLTVTPFADSTANFSPGAMSGGSASQAFYRSTNLTDTSKGNDGAGSEYNQLSYSDLAGSAGGYYVPPYYPIQQHQMPLSEAQYRFDIVSNLPWDVFINKINNKGLSGRSFTFQASKYEVFGETRPADKRVGLEEAQVVANWNQVRINSNSMDDSGNKTTPTESDLGSWSSSQSPLNPNSGASNDIEVSRQSATVQARVDSALLQYQSNTLTPDGVYDILDVLRASQYTRGDTFVSFYNPIKGVGNDNDIYVSRVNIANTTYWPSILNNGYEAVGGKEIAQQTNPSNVSFTYFAMPSLASCVSAHTNRGTNYSPINYEFEYLYSEDFLKGYSADGKRLIAPGIKQLEEKVKDDAQYEEENKAEIHNSNPKLLALKVALDRGANGAKWSWSEIVSDWYNGESWSTVAKYLRGRDLPPEQQHPPIMPDPAYVPGATEEEVYDDIRPDGIPNIDYGPVVNDVLNDLNGSLEFHQTDRQLDQDQVRSVLNVLAWADFMNAADSEKAYDTESQSRKINVIASGKVDPTKLRNIQFNTGAEMAEAGYTHNWTADNYNGRIVPVARTIEKPEESEQDLRYLNLTARGVEGATALSTDNYAVYTGDALASRIDTMLQTSAGASFPYSSIMTGRLVSGMSTTMKMQSHTVDLSLMKSSFAASSSETGKMPIGMSFSLKSAAAWPVGEAITTAATGLVNAAGDMLTGSTNMFSQIMFPSAVQRVGVISNDKGNFYNANRPEDAKEADAGIISDLVGYGPVNRLPLYSQMSDSVKPYSFAWAQTSDDYITVYDPMTGELINQLDNNNIDNGKKKRISYQSLFGFGPSIAEASELTPSSANNNPNAVDNSKAPALAVGFSGTEAWGITQILDPGGWLHNIYGLLQALGLSFIMTSLVFIACGNFLAFIKGKGVEVYRARKELAEVAPRALLAIFMVGWPPIGDGMGWQGGGFVLLEFISGIIASISNIFMTLPNGSGALVFLSQMLTGDLGSYGLALLYMVIAFIISIIFLIMSLILYIQGLGTIVFFVLSPVVWSFFVWPFKSSSENSKGLASITSAITDRLGVGFLSGHKVGTDAAMGLVSTYTRWKLLLLSWLFMFWLISIVIANAFDATNANQLSKMVVGLLCVLLMLAMMLWTFWSIIKRAMNALANSPIISNTRDAIMTSAAFNGLKYLGGKAGSAIATQAGGLAGNVASAVANSTTGKAFQRANMVRKTGSEMAKLLASNAAKQVNSSILDATGKDPRAAIEAGAGLAKGLAGAANVVRKGTLGSKNNDVLQAALKDAKLISDPKARNAKIKQIYADHFDALGEDAKKVFSMSAGKNASERSEYYDAAKLYKALQDSDGLSPKEQSKQLAKFANDNPAVWARLKSNGYIGDEKKNKNGELIAAAILPGMRDRANAITNGFRINENRDGYLQLVSERANNELSPEWLEENILDRSERMRLRDKLGDNIDDIRFAGLSNMNNNTLNALWGDRDKNLANLAAARKEIENQYLDKAAEEQVILGKGTRGRALQKEMNNALANVKDYIEEGQQAQLKQEYRLKAKQAGTKLGHGEEGKKLASALRNQLNNIDKGYSSFDVITSGITAGIVGNAVQIAKVKTNTALAGIDALSSEQGIHRIDSKLKDNNTTEQPVTNVADDQNTPTSNANDTQQVTNSTSNNINSPSILQPNSTILQNTPKESISDTKIKHTGDQKVVEQVRAISESQQTKQTDTNNIPLADSSTNTLNSNIDNINNPKPNMNTTNKQTIKDKIDNKVSPSTKNKISDGIKNMMGDNLGNAAQNIAQTVARGASAPNIVTPSAEIAGMAALGAMAGSAVANVVSNKSSNQQQHNIQQQSQPQPQVQPQSQLQEQLQQSQSQEQSTSINDNLGSTYQNDVMSNYNNQQTNNQLDNHKQVNDNQLNHNTNNHLNTTNKQEERKNYTTQNTKQAPTSSAGQAEMVTNESISKLSDNNFVDHTSVNTVSSYKQPDSSTIGKQQSNIKTPNKTNDTSATTSHKQQENHNNNKINHTTSDQQSSYNYDNTIPNHSNQVSSSSNNQYSQQSNTQNNPNTPNNKKLKQDDSIRTSSSNDSFIPDMISTISDTANSSINAASKIENINNIGTAAGLGATTIASALNQKNRIVNHDKDMNNHYSKASLNNKPTDFVHRDINNKQYSSDNKNDYVKSNKIPMNDNDIHDNINIPRSAASHRNDISNGGFSGVIIPLDDQDTTNDNLINTMNNIADQNDINLFYSDLAQQVNNLDLSHNNSSNFLWNDQIIIQYVADAIYSLNGDINKFKESINNDTKITHKLLQQYEAYLGVQLPFNYDNIFNNLNKNTQKEIQVAHNRLYTNLSVGLCELFNELSNNVVNLSFINNINNNLFNLQEQIHYYLREVNDDFDLLRFEGPDVFVDTTFEQALEYLDLKLPDQEMLQYIQGSKVYNIIQESIKNIKSTYYDEAELLYNRYRYGF